MGMAASQARYLALTARKTNCEYEGQQINQARTALANQSSELWNKLYDMTVPTAPSSNDYTTTQYSFKNGDSTQTISSIQDADQILVLDDGKISGLGSHEELLKSNVMYKETYEAQNNGGDFDEQ